MYIHTFTFLLTLYSIYNVMHAHMYSVSNTFLELFTWDKLMDQITMIHTTESQVAVIVIGRVCLGLISPDSGDIEILQWPLLEPCTCMYVYVQLLIHGKGNANIFYMDINLSNRGYLCSEYIHSTCSLQVKCVGMSEILVISTVLCISTATYTVSSWSLHWASVTTGCWASACTAIHLTGHIVIHSHVWHIIDIHSIRECIHCWIMSKHVPTRTQPQRLVLQCMAWTLHSI